MTIMKDGLEGIRASAMSRIQVRWGFVALLVAILLLRSYFVRVLLASEFFFALVFAALLLIGGAAYLIGAVAAEPGPHETLSVSQRFPPFGKRSPTAIG